MSVKTYLLAEREQTRSCIHLVFHGSRYEFICLCAELTKNQFRVKRHVEIS